MKLLVFVFGFCSLFASSVSVVAPPVEEPEPRYGMEPVTTITCQVGRMDLKTREQEFFSRTCSSNYDACETKLEIHPDRHIVTKSCGHEDSCYSNAETNPGTCNYTIDTNGDYLCYYCCTTNNCNFFEFRAESDHTSEVMLRRNGTISFDRPWTDYQNGFGDCDGEYFIGLEFLHDLTEYYSSCVVTACYADCATGYRTFSDFVVGDNTTDYEVDYEPTSNSGASPYLAHDFTGISEGDLPVPFSTYDDDNDASMSNCADFNDGGWWYHDRCSGRGPTRRWRSIGEDLIEISIDCGSPNPYSP